MNISIIFPGPAQEKTGFFIRDGGAATVGSLLAHVAKLMLVEPADLCLVGGDAPIPEKTAGGGDTRVWPFYVRGVRFRLFVVPKGQNPPERYDQATHKACPPIVEPWLEAQRAASAKGGCSQACANKK